MANQREREMVAVYTDGTPGPSPRRGGGISRDDQVQGLLELADHLQVILVPVRPDPSFRRRLHGDLILQAQQRQGEPQQNLFRQHRKGILIGATLGSIASVAGILAFVLRLRHSRATPMAGG